MFGVDLSDLIAAAGRLQLIWESVGIEFCFIGGLAVNHWGQPRQTDDVAATVWTDFGNEQPIIELLLKNLFARIERSELISFRRTRLRICGPSDLVILKAFANRPHDWVDIRGILIRSELKLDWNLIDTELTVLANLKEEPEIVDQLRRLRNSMTSN